MSQLPAPVPEPQPPWPPVPREAPPPLRHPPGPAARGTARRDRPWINLTLLLATLASTTVIGACHHQGFVADLDPVAKTPLVLWHGLWYSLTVLAILGIHELGHYYACRHYRVDASLPYFLPAPILIGTLGAFIRIRQPIPTKRMLFDIGVAGPIAGFVVAVPALFVGVSFSRILPAQAATEATMYLGEPLLFRFAAWAVWGAIPEGSTLSLHPMGFAAWVGLLATALNLFPIGQLDGGHISYAVFGARSTLVTLVTAAVLFALAFHSPSWIVWAVLMVVMLVALGPRHPRTLDHDVPIDRTRMLVAAFALVMFVLCFTPAPIRIIGELGQ